MPPFFMAAILPGYAADQLLDPMAAQPEYAKNDDGNYYNKANSDPWNPIVKSVATTTTTTKTRSSK